MGTKQDNLFAFARTWKPENAKTTQDILVVVPRLIVGLTGGTEQLPLGAKVWKDTWLKLGHAQAGQSYENLFTGEVLTTGEQWDTVGLPLASVCAHFPVALLVRQ
jgi:maltooligosyltrehalose synthase